MYKDEFLKILRECLQGEIPDYKVEENLRYYSNYISDTSDGKSEDEKLRELGDPHLIARTIIDTAEVKTDPMHQGKQGYYYDEEAGDTGTDYEEYENFSGGIGHTIFHLTWQSMKWYQKLLAVILLVLIVAALVALLVVSIQLFFSIVLPVLIILTLVRLIFFKNRRM